MKEAVVRNQTSSLLIRCRWKKLRELQNLQLWTYLLCTGTEICYSEKGGAILSCHLTELAWQGRSKTGISIQVEQHLRLDVRSCG